MHVVIEARALNNKGGGTGTYVRELTKHLKAIAPHESFTTIASFPWLSDYPLRRWQPDIIHYTKAALPLFTGLPSVVTIYDVIPLLFPQGQRLAARLSWPAVLRHAARASDHIVTISETSKRDIMKYFGITSRKITVTPLAVDTERFKTGSDPVSAGGLTPYILFVGQREPRKNIGALVRAFSKIANKIPHELVIAGRAYYKAEKIFHPRVRVLDYVPYEDLPALYAGADLFVWPSIYEGWGLPPMEAMACGTPVIVSNGGALPEVVGDAGEIVPFSIDHVPARLHDHDFEDRLAQTILQTLSNKEKLATMRERGLGRVKQFSWDEVARKTLAVYRGLIT